MKTRREFLVQTLGSGVAAASLLQTGCVNKRALEVLATRERRPRIKSVILRDDTILRLGGVGDNWHMTWAADDRQYISLCDGYGWSMESTRGHYNSRLFFAEGCPHEATFSEVPGYPLLIPQENSSRYYNFGVIALGERFYQFLSTWMSGEKGLRFAAVKLIYSPDSGRTWCNQDGSSPVVWEEGEKRSKEKMLFIEEDQEAFSLLSVLQMGRNYQDNRDGYVYVYAPNGNMEGTMNELVMFRVPKGQILNRGAYEYFAGLMVDGNANWSSDILARKPVHTFPRGWVNRLLHPFAWLPSIGYNAPLGVYMMVNWGTGSGTGIANWSGAIVDDLWFTKPSYLGFWTAPQPWGPWTQIHEEMAWAPNRDAGAQCYSPIIAPKWVAADGKSFWLVWTDFQKTLTPEENKRRQQEIKRLSPNEQVKASMQLARIYKPYYAFNIQRVDLVVP